MRIAICDDNSMDLKAMWEVFRRVAPAYTLDSFSDSRKLLDTIAGGTSYDLLFLDILIPGITGMEPGGRQNRPRYAGSVPDGQRRLCCGSVFCQGAALHP